MKAAYLLGRMAFGGFFLYSGIRHFQAQEEIARYAGGKNIPAPDLAVQLSGAALAIGGASILLGVKPQWGALAVIGFLAAVSPVMHDFWRRENPGERQSEMINFSKNMALLAAAMMVSGMEHGKAARQAAPRLKAA